MSQTTTFDDSTDQGAESSVGVRIPFDQLSQSGAYVCNWSGHLLRVSEDGPWNSKTPMFEIVGPGGLYVTKVSNDPFVTLSRARLLAANCDMNVNF